MTGFSCSMYLEIVHRSKDESCADCWRCQGAITLPLDTMMNSNLAVQDLWNVMCGDHTMPPEDAAKKSKWKIKFGKALFVIKQFVDAHILKCIEDV